EDQARLDPEDVEGLQPQGGQAVRPSRLPGRVPDREGILGMAPDLVAELAGVAGPGDEDGRAAGVAEPSDGEAEPAQLLHRRPGRRGPDEGLEDRAARGPLDGEVVQLVGRALDPDAAESQPLRLLPQPDPVVIIAADEPEVGRAEAEDGRVV